MDNFWIWIVVIYVIFSYLINYLLLKANLTNNKEVDTVTAGIILTFSPIVLPLIIFMIFITVISALILIVIYFIAFGFIKCMKKVGEIIKNS